MNYSKLFRLMMVRKPELVPIQKREILVEIKACDKFNHRHVVAIPRIKFLA